MISVLVLLILSSIYDLKKQKVPYLILVAGSVTGVIYTICRVITLDYEWWECAVGLIPGIFFLIMAFITGKIGYGDGWMLLIVGLFLGYGQCAGAFMLSLFLASGASVIMLLFRKAGRNSSFPYIPFLTAGVILTSQFPFVK